MFMTMSGRPSVQTVCITEQVNTKVQESQWFINSVLAWEFLDYSV